MYLNTLWISLTLLLLSMVGHVWCSLVTMRGGEYIVKDLRGEKIHSEALHVVFQFKTIDPSSLLLFSANHQLGDFISLELIGGKLR